MSKKDNTLLYVGLGLAAIFILKKKQAAPATNVNPVLVQPGSSNMVTTNTNPVTSIANSLANIFKSINNSPASASAQPVVSTSPTPQQTATNDFVSQSVNDIFSTQPLVPAISTNQYGNQVSTWSPNVTNAFNSGNSSNLDLTSLMTLDEMS